MNIGRLVHRMNGHERNNGLVRAGTVASES